MNHENCHFLYYKTQGYRKVTGTKCTGGVNLGPVVKPCPLNPNHKFVILVLFTSILVIFGLTFWTFKRVFLLVYLMTVNRYQPATSRLPGSPRSTELPSHVSTEEESDRILHVSNPSDASEDPKRSRHRPNKRLKAD
jgi:hypothetical protein